jgi:ribosome-associated toxin RatA of RatAB toxin-antitoxin module
VLFAAGRAEAGPAPPVPVRSQPKRVHVKLTPVPGHDMPRIDATLLIEAPAEKVWALISDCNRAAEFMEVEQSRLLWRRGNTSRCRVVVDVPFPFGTLTSVSDSREERGPSLLRLRFGLVSGDFYYDEGAWELTPLPGGRTRVHYQALTEPKLPVPTALLRSGQVEYIEKMLLKLHEQLLTH